MLRWSLHTGAWALIDARVSIFISSMLVAEHQVVGVKLTSFGRFHQLVRLVGCI